MTRQKPIRKDRVFLAAAIVAAAVVVPLLWPRDRAGKETPTAAPTGPSRDAETPAGTSQVPSGPIILEHVVRSGETLAEIASSLGVSVEGLMASNRLLDAEAAPVGRTLRASPLGILDVLQRGQTLDDLAETYDIPAERIVEANALADPQGVGPGTELLVPGASPSVWESVISLSLGQEGRFIRPVEAAVVGPYGWRIHPVLGIPNHHDGIDFDVPVGTVVRAAAAGRVTFAAEQEGPGLLVVVQHEAGYSTSYGHLSEALVRVGQFVEVGQPIARSGNSGISSGPHLHFEIQNGGFAVDPLLFFP